MSNQIHIVFEMYQEGSEPKKSMLVSITLFDQSLSIDDVLNKAKEAVEKQNKENDFEIPYSYNWGDVFMEGENQYFNQYGFNVDNVDYIPTFWHDELVILDD